MTLAATDLLFTRGSRPVLKGLSFDLKPGELVGVLGINGAGKTTLLKLLAGILSPVSGEVRLDDALLAAAAPTARARRIVFLAQDAACAWPMPVREVVLLGRHPYVGFAGATDEDRRIAEDAMREGDVMHLVERRADALSGGEQRRVQLARALAGTPQYLLADEPVAGLDPAHQLHTLELLRTKAESGMGVLATLHDIPLAIRYCHRLALLHKGTIVREGYWRDVCTPELMRKVLNISLAPVTIDSVETALPWNS
jgi:iron complex transport system ATP-binding protein